MTITKDGVRITIRCNACPTVRVDQEGIRARWRPNNVVWKEAQDVGWTAKEKPGVSDWQHFCPVCSR